MVGFVWENGVAVKLVELRNLSVLAFYRYKALVLVIYELKKLLLINLTRLSFLRCLWVSQQKLIDLLCEHGTNFLLGLLLV